MNWQNIFEGAMGSLIATIIGGGFLFLIGKTEWKNKLMVDKNNKEFKISKINPFAIGLFITSFFGVLSLFGFYLEWIKFPYILTIAILSGFATSLIYTYQCPDCKRIFTRKKIHTEIIKEEKRPYYYRNVTIYLYSDDTEKDRKYNGKEKKRMETIRTQRDYFICNSCKHEWDSSPYEINLDINSRPKANTVKTKIDPPNPFGKGFS